MIGMPAGTRIWIVAGVTDLRRWFTGLSGMVQTALAENPFSGQVFVFRGKRGDLIKVLWWSGDGLCLFAKRLERGRFIWPQATSGAVSLTQAQLSMLLEGIDWRRPVRSYGSFLGNTITFSPSPSVFGLQNGNAAINVGLTAGNGELAGALSGSPGGSVTVGLGTGTGIFGTFAGASGNLLFVPLVCRE